MVEQALFYGFSMVAIVTALLVITNRNAVYSAIFLVIAFFCLAGLYVLLNAQFIAAVQVIVYAGAVMVLFIFVIMLLSSGDESLREPFSIQRVIGFALAVLMGIQLIFALKSATFHGEMGTYTQEAIARVGGNSEQIGISLFTKFLYPFEAVSILLLIAIVGAVVLGRKKS